ncbi:MAG: sulfate adenylyltransferase small subunit [Betaproteobacteria bacterium TMED82]|nr:MAG: sulfate adenylyltransferase small subunit [Betaproteobacteria bacterium TMED82]|tara:strand:+ start:21124 stop:22041 length:918 start_codon:yes stop_codon:yes gene_type:complete
MKTKATVESTEHLEFLENESIFIMREVAATSKNPVLLFSGGKDSVVMLRIAQKAFAPMPLPFPLLHIDTGHNFSEVLAFRDEKVTEINANLIIRKVEDSIKRGTVKLKHQMQSRNAAQSITLLEAIEEFEFDALLGGARRDEEKARAKERIFSFRNEFGHWDPKSQRPELWDLFNTRHQKDEHMRVFPISNWTELDIWKYIQFENLKLPNIYFAHPRKVFYRKNLLVPLTSYTPPEKNEKVIEKMVRFRTVGDITCTCPIESLATSPREIISETAASDLSERGATRLDDQTEEASMEKRKKEGYF